MTIDDGTDGLVGLEDLQAAAQWPDRTQAMSDDDGLPTAKQAGGGAPFDGPVEFAQALYAALQHAEQVSTRRICWSDADFANWPLGEVEWVELLTRWARVGGRELVMICGDYAEVERRHPRFALWRRDWAHVIQCLVPDEARTAPLPTVWIDAADQALRVFDREHWRGRASFDRVDRQRAREDFDALLQRAAPGFASVTLGL
jgi:hypothetical protein